MKPSSKPLIVATRRRGLACLCLLLAFIGCASQSQSLMPGSSDPHPSPWQVLGQSREGRPVLARTLGAPKPGQGALRVAVIAGIHGDEQEGLRHLDEIVGWLGEVPAEVRLIADASPDGSAAGTRHTTRGVDPNRNWPASNFSPSPQRGAAPLSEPEVAAVHRDLVAFDPQLVVVLHSTRRGPFVNYDGPAEGYAERFAAAAGEPWRVEPSMGYPTPGSFGSWMGVDRGVATLTIEFLRGSNRAESGPALRRGLASLFGPSTPTAPFVR